MSSDDPITDDDLKAVEAFSRYLANEDLAVTKVLNLILGEIPDWLPLPSKSSATRNIQYLFGIGLSEDEIAQHVKEARADALSYPGNIIDSVAFSMQVYELAKLADSVALGVNDGLRELAGNDAVRGNKVIWGAKSGHQSTHGTEAEKLDFCLKVKEMCKNMKSRNPALGITEIRRRVAKELDVSPKTIQRYTDEWRSWLT